MDLTNISVSAGDQSQSVCFTFWLLAGDELSFTGLDIKLLPACFMVFISDVFTAACVAERLCCVETVSALSSRLQKLINYFI